MATLTASLQEQLEHQREQDWRRQGVPEADIALSRQTGMDAADIGVFRRFSQRGLLFIVRCPKPTARAHHGRFQPKPLAVKDKTGSSGLVVNPGGAIMVSDYDLMSVWRKPAAGWEKVFISAAGGAARGTYAPESRALLVEINRQLVSRLQHGCQDDFHSPKNPGVKATDHFAAFSQGSAKYLASPSACKTFYDSIHLPWVYDAGGSYKGAGAR
jgi:hypothetical protein